MNLDAAPMTKTSSIFLFVAVTVVSAGVYFWNLNVLPLADYDEATYAQVTVNTLSSGDFLTLKRFENPWFEKPPLYFLLSMGAVKVFGTEDYVFRLTSALTGVVSIVLLWLIVQRLADARAATVAAAVLLFSPFYYLAARQVRLDVPVIAAILGALLALVYGFRSRRALYFIGPALAIGFMFKSFIVALAIPMMLIFAWAYRQFAWLRAKELWLGLLGGLALVVPWHWYEYSRWGSDFVQTYFGYHVLGRFTEGIGQNAGFQLPRYVAKVSIHGQPWVSVAALVVLAAVAMRLSGNAKKADPLLRASALSALLVFAVFSFGKTGILTYLLPSFPFIAILCERGFSAVAAQARTKQLRGVVAMAIAMIVGIAAVRTVDANSSTAQSLYYTWSQDQENIGRLVREGGPDATFYLFDWPTHEALRYYSGKELDIIGFPPPEDTVLKAPWYLMVANLQMPFFLNPDGSVKPEFADIEIKYRNNSGQLFLLAGDSDLVLSK